MGALYEFSPPLSVIQITFSKFTFSESHSLNSLNKFKIIFNLLSEFRDFLVTITIHIRKIEIFCHKNVAGLSLFV